VSLQLFAGEVLAIIGDNGAGKSTLIKCLTGAELPDEGEILLEGTPARSSGRRMHATPGSRPCTRTSPSPPRSTWQATCTWARGAAARRARQRLPCPRHQGDARSGPARSSPASGISTLQDVTVAVENLSGGQRQAVAVARAAAFGSKVVVLDEPTAASASASRSRSSSW
jgi:fructose transport system ATP-binding protein